MHARSLSHFIFAVVLLNVPFYADKTDQCGPATLASVLSFWGKSTDPNQLRKEMYLDQLKGTLPMDLVLAAEAHGLKTQMIRGDLSVLQTELQAGRPVLAMLNVGLMSMTVNHYVVVTGYDDARQGLYMHSAGKENQFMGYKKFLRAWRKADEWTMLARKS